MAVKKASKVKHEAKNSVITKKADKNTRCNRCSGFQGDNPMLKKYKDGEWYCDYCFDIIEEVFLFNIYFIIKFQKDISSQKVFEEPSEITSMADQIDADFDQKCNNNDEYIDKVRMYIIV